MRTRLIAVALIQSGLIVAQAWLLAGIVHAVVIDGRELGQMAFPLTLLLATAAARAGTETLRGWIASGSAARVQRKLRPRLFEHIAEAGPAFAAHTGVGALSTTLIEQVDLLERWYGRFLPQAIAAVVSVPVLLIAVGSRDWLAGLFLALATPLIPLFMILIGWGAEQASRNQQRELTRLGGVFLDRLRGLDTIRRFGSEQYQLERLGELVENFRQRTLAVLRLAFLSTAAIEFFSAVAIAAVAIYVGLGLLGYIQFGPAPALTLHGGLFVLLLAAEFFQPLRQLSQAWHDRADGLAAAGSIRTVMETPPARREPLHPATISPGAACRVEAVGLCLQRPGRGVILEDAGFTAEPGQCVLIRGASGSGKSTLLDLVGGFLVPDSGTIHLDGVELQQLDAQALSNMRAWMGQNGGLFDTSLADNIRLSMPQADETALDRAVSAAGLSDWITQLPEGMATPIRSSGEGLSGGQARRVLLARALLRPRPLLLLDEPTASLDIDTAESLWKTLGKLSRGDGPTVICASHDVLAEAWADRIFQLENGRLEELRP
ncbi:thiol reductant ABC exporter subunit CydD [Wenzhouxiangella sp. XN201]|uniref:thiol reductant ABC exporter subunit CydD n=1 Tax=Wenzhouxiangella sp. XN201 TaxID=2710755 RepID=UPI0013CA1384|nr:thiol reductant ABC exporter subunit CydD [Wenzhouxiangella sp. XN201]NEZ03740.1 thiol reductant ABC exporter subunit CydD [Wenzhouxiangella sp. XN201]